MLKQRTSSRARFHSYPSKEIIDYEMTAHVFDNEEWTVRNFMEKTLQQS